MFMGHRVGHELAECFASADVFAFPSFTEVSHIPYPRNSPLIKDNAIPVLTIQTFGQVVLEAMASGLPVVGLDAEGTRDLVTHAQTGLLLPQPPCDWSTACQRSSSHFRSLAQEYAGLLSRSCTDHHEREAMSRSASTEGVKGYTWWDAMEARPVINITDSYT